MGILDRLLGRSDAKSAAAVALRIETIIKDFSATWQQSAPAGGCVADVRKLSHPKEQIRQALLYAMDVTKDAAQRNALATLYIELPNWQEGVGDQVVGLDIDRIDPNLPLDEIAKRVAALEPVSPVLQARVDAEVEQAKAELTKRRLWGSPVG